MKPKPGPCAVTWSTIWQMWDILPLTLNNKYTMKCSEGLQNVELESWFLWRPQGLHDTLLATKNFMILSGKIGWLSSAVTIRRSGNEVTLPRTHNSICHQHFQQNSKGNMSTGVPLSKRHSSQPGVDITGIPWWNPTNSYISMAHRIGRIAKRCMIHQNA